MITDINTEDRLVQQTFSDHLRDKLGWETVYAYNTETFGPAGTLGRSSIQDAVLIRDLRAALLRLNPALPEVAREIAVAKLTETNFSRSVIQLNRDFYAYIKNGVPVEWRDAAGETQSARAHVIDFRNGVGADGEPNNRFVAVRELKLQGLRVPNYNRRADLVCFVNGLPLVFFELKAVYKNIRAGFDGNLSDYLSESSISHAFHHNAFLVVSNGDAARYGSITSKWDHFVEWKRNAETDQARVDAEALLDGMLAKERLLDLVENFILFDDSRAGGTRKIVARNHQVMGVNNAVASVLRQEQLKRQFPLEKRIVAYEPEVASAKPRRANADAVALVQRAHPDLGRLGVFWHTQGSGKSYSMLFFAEKVRRVVPGNFTFVVVTDREDLDDQIWRTFVGCGVTDDKTPRARSGKALQELLLGNHRFVFSLIHKFNRPVKQPYSERDDVIVMSDEAHRTQAGRFARNMRLALPNAAFIGFTGTPLFKHDELTRRIFGDYVSRYDFKRAEEDHSTVRLVYENRGEKLGLAKLDLNDRIAKAIEKAELKPEQKDLLERLLGKDYEVITADDRLDKLADDFVEHCSARWRSGKSMFVCIDKITCARMLQRIRPRWATAVEKLQARMADREAELAGATEAFARARLGLELEGLRSQVEWMATTRIELVISEAQNEVRDFKKWGFDIIPHRKLMKTGFELPDGQTMPLEKAFKDPKHPFRVAVVCAMWLTGFDVECLSTLYIDKPMKAHTLMQAIARANRVFPGKDCGVIVDYNGVLKSLRHALALYAQGEDEGDEPEVGGVVTPIEDLVDALVEAIEAAEQHLKDARFDVARLNGATGFDRIKALRDAVDALYSSDETRRKYEILARMVFSRFIALVTEPSAKPFAERHDNLEAIYKKLEEKRDHADVTEVLKELHRIVNEAIRAMMPGDDQAVGLTVDLSRIDFVQLRDEFARKVQRKNTAVQDIREVVEKKLATMLATNPTRMDFYKKYTEIIADYNREKDRATVEDTFARLVELAASLDVEQRRAAEEGLTDDELALFDLLFKKDISKKDRDMLKDASRDLLGRLNELLEAIEDWSQKEHTRADVKVCIVDTLYKTLPRPPFTEADTYAVADKVYEYVWRRAAGGNDLVAA